MKFKSLLTVAFAAVSMLASAQSKTVNVETAGTLSTLISGDDLNVKELTLTGNINKLDLSFIRKSMKVEVLDLKDVNIAACSETEGEVTTEYPANEFPSKVFQKDASSEETITLTKVIFPASITSIGAHAFESSSGSVLETIDLSNCSKLETVGEYAFEFCAQIKNLDLSNLKSLKTIEKYAFGQTKAVNINLEGCSALETLGERAFYQSYECMNVNLNGCTALKTIGNRAFLNLSKNSVKIDGYNLVLDFSPCTSLESFDESACQSAKAVAIKLPASVKTLAKNTFYLCSNAQSTTFYGSTVPEMGSNAMQASLKGKPCYVPQGAKAAFEAADFTDVHEFDVTGINATVAAMKANNKSYSIDGKLYSGKGIRVVAGKKYTK